MSEYQYYEFLALDRALTPEEKDYVASISSRVQITSNQAIFVYNYGDFRGNPHHQIRKNLPASSVVYGLDEIYPGGKIPHYQKLLGFMNIFIGGFFRRLADFSRL